MKEHEKMLLSDAIYTAVEAEKKAIWCKRIICVLSAVIVYLFARGR